MGPDIAELLRQHGGVIRRADHPQLAQRLARLRRSGELISPLPGVLVLPECRDDAAAALLAGQLWAGPSAVLTGAAAASVTFWPEITVDTIDFCSAERVTSRRGRWTKSHRVLPPEFVWPRSGLQVTAPALTAVDLAGGPLGGEAIDRALRSRKTTLDQMWQAYASQPNRIGNQRRAWLLRDSRDRPWSEGERELHRLQRRHRITGWETNAWVAAGQDGYYVDILFRRERLIIEFDGWEFHSDREAFERDRRRRNELVLAGYRVLNFTWQQVVEDPRWVIRCIRTALGR